MVIDYGSYEWPPSGGSGGGVTSLNGESGAVVLVAGTGISVTPSGQNITIANTAPSVPGGTSGQVQYNNSGAFGGFGSWNGTTLAITGAISSTTTLAVGTNLHVFGTSIMAGDMVVQGGANFSGNLGFYGATEIPQPSGNIFTALTNLGLVTSPSLSAGDIPALPYANQALSNLASVAMNTTLLPAVDTATNLGSPSKRFFKAYILELNDSSDVVSVDVTNRSLTKTSAADVSIDWGNRDLINPAGQLVLDWSGTHPSLNTHKLTNVVDPTAAQDAATKNYVDTHSSGITQLTGDGTAGPGSGSQAFTLATVNSNVGSFGSSTAIPSFTVNGKGLITAASTNVVIAPAGTLTGTTLASNVVTSSLTSVGTITTGVWNGTAINETHGGTNQTSYTTGDTLYASASNTLSKLAVGGNGNYLTVAAGIPAWTSVTPGAPVAPTVQRFTSGSGTYTTPTSPSPLYIKVTLMGGGGGGAGTGNSPGTAAGAGGDTTFGTSLLTAGGGGGGTFNSIQPNGGTNTITAGTTLLNVSGATGGAGSGTAAATPSNGGSSAFGGAGGGGYGGLAGLPATTNSGSGGGGGGASTSGADGLGGGSGGYVVSWITSPSSTYSYGVGAAGAAGGAGVAGFAGGDGGSGIVLVEEFYQ